MSDRKITWGNAKKTFQVFLFSWTVSHVDLFDFSPQSTSTRHKPSNESENAITRQSADEINSITNGNGLGRSRGVQNEFIEKFLSLAGLM